MTTGDSSLTPLSRHLHLIRMLGARRFGLTVQDAAAELGVSVKTIRRDLQRLVDEGLPLSEQTGTRGVKKWHIDSIDMGPPLRFDEALALQIAVGSLAPLAGSPFWHGAREALKKLRSGLPERALKYLNHLADAVYQTQPRRSDYRDKTELIDQIVIGMEERKDVFVAYHSRSSTEPLTYPISPYAIVWHLASLYVIGFSGQHEAIRTWKVDRISEAEVTQFPFTRPEDFDVQQYLQSGLGIYRGEPSESIRVQFSPSASRAVQETQWHASEQLTPQPDGSLIATYQLAITPDVIGWLLSFGPDAVVLSPQTLVDQIGRQLQAMQDSYGFTSMETSP